MRRWAIFGAAMLALAGCVTTSNVRVPSAPQEKAELPAPEAMKACGPAALPGNQVFEICGIGPEGDQTKLAVHQMYTQICGPIDVTDEMKAYLCQKADAMFDAMNPRRGDDVIAAGFPNKTRAFYSRELGNEIHYLASDGKGYFWLAHQRNVLTGEWLVFRNQQVCYHVPGLTEHQGTKWRCGPIRASGLTEIAEGDVLGLAKHGDRSAPWVLQSQPRITLAEAKQRIDVTPRKKEGEGTEPPAKGPSGPSEPVPSDPLGPMVMFLESLQDRL